MQGLSYQEMMYSKNESTGNPDMSLAKFTEEDLKRLIEKNHSTMVKDGVICVIGLAVTIITLSMAEGKGGSYVIAWGAILFGGIGFFRALGEKDKYQSLLNDMIAKKEDLPGNIF
jgi:hypothetical protein